MWQFWPFGLLNLFPVFPCDMVVGTFSMSFLGGKYFKAVVSVLVYEIPTLRLPGNRQRKGSKSIVIFLNTILLCGRIFCVFHFLLAAVKKAGVLSFAWMLFYNLLRVTNFSFVWHEIEFSDNIAVIKFA